MEVEEIQREISEGPRVVNESNVMHYSRHCRTLKGTVRNKAILFLRHNCIHYLGYDVTFDSKYTFIVLPLNQDETFVHKGITLPKDPFELPGGKGYNISEYLIYKRESDKRWICNCQGWRGAERNEDKRKSDGIQCSHSLSLILAFKIKRFGRRQGASEQDMLPEAE